MRIDGALIFVSQKSMYSFLAFEALFDGILGMQFFAIVLDHSTTATNHFYSFLPNTC